MLKLWYKAKPNDATVNGVFKFQDTSGATLAKDVDFSGTSGYRYDVTILKAVKAAQKTILGQGYHLSATVGDPQGIFALGKPVAVIYKYEKSVTPPNPNPKPEPKPTPTPQPNPTPTPKPNEPIAAKNEAVYALKKVYLYQKPTFKKSQRKAGYISKPRVYRPMFVVTGYARSTNGVLRYKLRDVNHLTKNRRKTGYITARWAYIRPVYYQSKHKTLTVINPRGVNEYRAADLSGKVRNFKQGQVLHVKKFVHHNLTTRYVLTNGHYITGNRKLVQMGRKSFPKAVKAKTAINRYTTVNLTHKNKHKMFYALMLSEIVELLRAGAMELTPANRMVVAQVTKAPTNYLVPITEDIKKRQPQSVNNYVRDAVLSVRKRRMTKIAEVMCDDLVKAGYLEVDGKTYYDNQTLTDRILTQLYQDAVAKKEPSEKNSMLAILLVNSGLVYQIFPKQEAETIELRLKEVMKSDQYHLISDVIKRINKDLASIIDAVRA